jgi:serine protease DegQ
MASTNRLFARQSVVARYNRQFRKRSVLRKLWLLFAQACTVCVAALFVVATLRPDLLPRLPQRASSVVLLQEARTPVAAESGAHYADAARKAMPSVVNVYTSKALPRRHPLVDDSLLRRYFPDLAGRSPQRATSLGSGVIVSPDGYLLTNHHVIDGADDIEVVLADGRQMKARLKGADPDSDLAVLKIDGENLPAITFASIERLQVGDVVLAIGNPFGFGNTVTMGIVSALGRNHLGINRFEDFIQTDAAINPGNSGGALVDTSGNLVGISSTIGIGFAIPVSLARNVFEQIVRDGEVTRGWFGVEPQDLTGELAQALGVDTGVIIKSLVRDGPAERAGVHAKDVVLEVGGKPTRDTPSLLVAIAELAPGAPAKVKLWRDRRPLEVEVTVGRRPKPEK